MVGESGIRQERFCGRCGGSRNKESAFCTFCGEPLDHASAGLESRTERAYAAFDWTPVGRELKNVGSDLFQETDFILGNVAVVCVYFLSAFVAFGALFGTVLVLAINGSLAGFGFLPVLLLLSVAAFVACLVYLKGKAGSLRWRSGFYKGWFGQGD